MALLWKISAAVLVDLDLRIISGRIGAGVRDSAETEKPAIDPAQLQQPTRPASGRGL